MDRRLFLGTAAAALTVPGVALAEVPGPFRAIEIACPALPIRTEHDGFVLSEYQLQDYTLWVRSWEIARCKTREVFLDKYRPTRPYELATVEGYEAYRSETLLAIWTPNYAHQIFGTSMSLYDGCEEVLAQLHEIFDTVKIHA